MKHVHVRMVIAIGAVSSHALTMMATVSIATQPEKGIYTTAQQKRGADIYNRECSTCHGETLKGGEGAPAIAGAPFWASYGGQPVADLFDRIRQTMPAPPEQPGKLTPQEYADVVAHILSVNNLPAGEVELPTEVEQLKRLRIAPPR